MITALEQVVEHLVLHELAVVAPAVREVDGVWRLPPPVAATLVGGARIVPAWHFVPFHTIELAPQAGARLDGAPPRLIQGGWRERDRPRGGEAVEAAEQQECGEPAGPKLHGVRRVRLTVPPAWSPPDRTQRPRSSGPSPGATARAHSETAPTHRARSAAGPRENRPQARSVAAASAGTG